MQSAGLYRAPGPRPEAYGGQRGAPRLLWVCALGLGPKPAMTLAPAISGLWSDCFLSLPPTRVKLQRTESRCELERPQGQPFGLSVTGPEMDPGLQGAEAHAQLLPEASVERRPTAMLGRLIGLGRRQGSNGLVTFLALGAFDLPWGKILEIEGGLLSAVPCNSVLGGPPDSQPAHPVPKITLVEHD